MEGGVSEWQVAGSVNVHQAPNVLELIAEYTLCRISKIDGAGALVWMAPSNRGSTNYSRVTPTMSKP